jgi:hypothetical protein
MDQIRELITVPIIVAARRRLLPQPCPCGRENGTVQLIVFNHKYRSSRQTVTCGIKHYYPEFYKITKEVQQEIGAEITGTITSKKKISYKSRWCSFQTRHGIDFVDSTGRRFPLTEYFEVYKDDSSKARLFRQTKAFTKLSRKEDGLSRKTTDGRTDTGRTISGNTGIMHCLRIYSCMKKRYLSLKGESTVNTDVGAYYLTWLLRSS